MIRVVLTGDLRPVDSISHLVGASGNMGSPFDKISQADLAFTNLETPLTDAGTRADKLIPFRSPPARAQEMKALGFDVASFANNHSLDYGIEGLHDTLRHVSEAQIAVVGAGSTIGEALSPVLLNTNGTRVGFLAFSSTLPAGSLPAEDRPGIAPIRVKTWIEYDAAAIEEQPGTSPYVHTQAYEPDVAQAEDVIRKTKDQCDLLIVSIHWGVPPGWRAPFQGPLADYQRPLGERLLAAGADVIAGTHPHVLHGIEHQETGVILYSLGNFLFHYEQPGQPPELQRPAPPYQLDFVKDDDTFESFLAELTVDNGRVTKLTVYPIRLDERGNPGWAVDEHGGRILGRLLDFSQALDTRLVLGEETVNGQQVPVATLEY